MTLEQCISRVAVDLHQCDVSFTENDDYKFTITANVGELYKDWYNECRMCPENGTGVSEIMFCTYEGKVFLVNSNEVLTFEDLMRAVERYLKPNRGDE